MCIEEEFFVIVVANNALLVAVFFQLIMDGISEWNYQNFPKKSLFDTVLSWLYCPNAK